MSEHRGFTALRRKAILYFIVALIAQTFVTPALADYLGPDRTKTETTTICKINLYECQYVASKGDYRYHKIDSWACSDESKPWKAYASQPSAQGCYSGTAGDTYWAKEDITQDVTTTYPPATISGLLQNCTLNNGWCTTAPRLNLTGTEPVAGYNIIAVEGTLNGQTFACQNASCLVPLIEGSNSFSYWALSSFGDSSTMGTLTAKVDSQLPSISGTLNGTSGSGGWFLGPVSFNGSASDSTSGLTSFTCTLDGGPLGSCTSITVNGDGAHTLVLTARDEAGNTRTLSQGISIDAQNPSLNAALSGARGANNWYTAATLNASASDLTPGSGLVAFEYNLDGEGWKTFPASGELTLPQGQHSVDLRSVDKAGRTTSSTKSFSLDSVAPEVILSPSGSLGTNNWFITPLNLSASAVDETSGLHVFEYSLDNDPWTPYSAPLTLTDGSRTISFWAEDKAGLVTRSEEVYRIDTRPPQIAGSISGTPGENGWYVSEVSISVSASDPLPGSGLDAFTFILDGSAEETYEAPLLLADGQHILQLTAQDVAGLTSFTQQGIRVDTVEPTLVLNTFLDPWIKGNILLSGIAGDSGSGLSSVEVSIDGGESWQSVLGNPEWSYEWDTKNVPDGAYTVHLRAKDQAGLVTEGTLTTGVDNSDPVISLPGSWLQWSTVTLDVSDTGSGLASVRVEISDPEGRWSTREISLDPAQFPLGFKWDRRFGDGTIAPDGTYDVKVIAADNLGNVAYQQAAVTVLLDILPPGPTATPQPTSISGVTPTAAYTATSQYPASPTSTSRTTSTPTSVATSRSSGSPTSIGTLHPATATKTPVISVFGNIDPTSQGQSTPTALPTRRVTPTPQNVTDTLDSVFGSNANDAGQTVEISASDPHSSQPLSSNSNVLWGATALAMVSAATASAAEERRRREEAEARQAALEAQEEQRRAKIKAQKMEKIAEQRAQEAAWEAALHPDFGTHGIDAKLDRMDQQEETQLIAARMAYMQELEERKRAAEEKKKAEELKAQLAAIQEDPRHLEAPVVVPAPAQSWWEKGLKWVDDHQTEVALGLGVAVGAAAIVLSGGIATPLVAAAWAAGATAVAAGAAAVGTIALNNHYGRAWNENLGTNVGVAAVGALAVTAGWFLYQIGTTSFGAYCVNNPNMCARAEPVFSAIDWAEQVSIQAKLTYYTWRGDEEKASQAAFDLQTELLDGGMPGNTMSKKVREELKDLGEDAVKYVGKYGVDVIPLLAKHGDEGLDLLKNYGDDGFRFLETYGDDAVKLTQKLKPLIGNDAFENVISQGPDAVKALSHWTDAELLNYTDELIARAPRDAKALEAAAKLAKIKDLQSPEAQALLHTIAENSIQPGGNRIVLGKWVDGDFDTGFIGVARAEGSQYYGPSRGLENAFDGLDPAEKDKYLWAVNQQALQQAVNNKLQIDYSFDGLNTRDINKEIQAIDAIAAGDAEKVEEIFGRFPFRMREVQFLVSQGYVPQVDKVTNLVHWTLP